MYAAMVHRIFCRFKLLIKTIKYNWKQLDQELQFVHAQINFLGNYIASR